MVLQDFILPSRVNLHCLYSGMDSPELCMDPEHFKNHTKNIEYAYNSRGFRDSEWPADLPNAVWCFGDSFTVGLGQPFEEIWPQRLATHLNRRTINVSMDGASNNWIARKVCNVLNTIQPLTVIIHWSFLNRREAGLEPIQVAQWNQFYKDVKDPTWPDCEYGQRLQLPEHIQRELSELHNDSWKIVDDEEQRVHVNVKNTLVENINNTLECIALVEKNKQSTNIVHSFVSDFAFGLEEDAGFNAALGQHGIKFIPEFAKIDLARDGFHYGERTVEHLVNKIILSL